MTKIEESVLGLPLDGEDNLIMPNPTTYRRYVGDDLKRCLLLPREATILEKWPRFLSCLEEYQNDASCSPPGMVALEQITYALISEINQMYSRTRIEKQKLDLTAIYEEWMHVHLPRLMQQWSRMDYAVMEIWVEIALQTQIMTWTPFRRLVKTLCPGPFQAVEQLRLVEKFKCMAES